MSECTPKTRPAGPMLKCDECLTEGPVSLYPRGDGHAIYLCSSCKETREEFGRVVRVAWQVWAREQPDAKPSWLVDYDQLPRRDREVDCRIAQAVLSHLYVTKGVHYLRPAREMVLQVRSPEVTKLADLARTHKAASDALGSHRPAPTEDAGHEAWQSWQREYHRRFDDAQATWRELLTAVLALGEVQL